MPTPEIQPQISHLRRLVTGNLDKVVVYAGSLSHILAPYWQVWASDVREPGLEF